ncbi:hypothetical protein LX32DRAFT_200157 [Colletotrichum zoysiae]|uniref:Uncharacterized protein n=1 Tax=Colletotrichum zoysiae TaxID=1216348 RepID=A0AAD9HNN5_9PEZI|nr:hypothetical protein LX32DRAFT_200157 [Colletotrichum zoysiae]
MTCPAEVPSPSFSFLFSPARLTRSSAKDDHELRCITQPTLVHPASPETDGTRWPGTSARPLIVGIPRHPPAASPRQHRHSLGSAGGGARRTRDDGLCTKHWFAGGQQHHRISSHRGRGLCYLARPVEVSCAANNLRLLFDERITRRPNFGMASRRMRATLRWNVRGCS